MESFDIVALQKKSKAGKTYYGLFALNDEGVEVLICFISKKQYEMLNHLTEE